MSSSDNGGFLEEQSDMMDSGRGEMGSGSSENGEVGEESPGDSEEGHLSYTISDHGTMLSIELHRDPPGTMSVDSCITNHPTAFALHYCKRKILQPYFKLLAVLGWRAWFPNIPTEDQCIFLKLLNLIYPMLVVGLLCAGYALQFLARFRGDRVLPAYRPLLLQPVTNTSSSQPPTTATTAPPSVEVVYADMSHLITLYLIPDLFHLLAYFYIFYLFRVLRSENMQTLMEKVFLQSSVTTYSGFCSQKKLIKRLRLFLVLAGIWVLLSLSSQILHVLSLPIHFYSIEEVVGGDGSTLHYLMLVVMLLGVLALNCVYVAIVMSYCTQCQLILVLIQSLCERIRERSVSIMAAMKEISECKKMLDFLNHHSALAVSLLMFNFSLMLVLGIAAVLDEKVHITLLMYLSTLLVLLLWSLLVILPLIQAVRVSGACKSLCELGHEVRIRPFGYQDLPPADLDSFLLYTSTLDMKTLIFCMPVRSSCLCGLLSALIFTVLLLCQLDVFHI